MSLILQLNCTNSESLVNLIDTLTFGNTQ